MVKRLIAIVALGCTPLEQSADYSQADPAAILVRTSLDLRGIRPSLDELDRLASDPTALDTIVEDYLHDDRFGARMADLYAEVLLTRGEDWPVPPQAYGPGVSAVDYRASIGDEVPRMVGYVAEHDLPWTDLVLADWTMANDVLRAIWPIEAVRDGETGWTPSRYTDGRPLAGALSANSLWWRYGSTFSNANRKRANAVSRIFLCNDYLHREIDFDRSVNLLDQGAVDDALATNPGCVSCHASLDPLSGYFYGFWYLNPNVAPEVTRYHPERELLWRDVSGVEPGYYGTPSQGLDALGRHLASDARYPQCAVQNFAEQLLRRPVTLADEDRLVAHREAFLQGDLTVRSLVRSIVLSPEYRAGATDDPRAVPSKLVTADLLHDQIEGLTGFRWTTQGGRDLLRSEQVGYRTLAGGADGLYVTSSATRPSATLLLVQARLAEAAADYVVRHDLRDPSQARMLRRVDGTETLPQGEAAIVAQIQELHRLIFGRSVAPDGPEVAANLALWSELYELTGEPQRAWVGLISALLRDPDLIVY